MSKKTVLLFSGQGAQEVGMGADVWEKYESAREIYAAADKQLGYNLAKLSFDGPQDLLTRTLHAQPALYVHGYVLLSMLRELVPSLRYEAVAGLSLGEFTAHAAAATYSFSDGLTLVQRRAEFMEEAATRTKGSMAALVGGEYADALALAREVGADIANLNAPGQIVISGPAEAIRKAVNLGREFRIRRVVELQVAGAYHSSLMASARVKLGEVLEKTPMQEPVVEVLSNYKAVPVHDPAEIRDALAKQVTGSVRWAESMQLLINGGFTRFVEIGPGGVLTGLMGKINKEVEAFCISDVPSLVGAVEHLK
jgi:[acyl-carrier-protein] S-malonyltransferase